MQYKIDQQASAHQWDTTTERKHYPDAQGTVLNALSVLLNSLHTLCFVVLFGMSTHVDSAGLVGLAIPTGGGCGPTSPASEGALEWVFVTLAGGLGCPLTEPATLGVALAVEPRPFAPLAFRFASYSRVE